MDLLEFTKIKNRNFNAALIHFITGAIVIIFYAVTKGAQNRSNFATFRNSPANLDDNTCSTNAGSYEVPSQCVTEISFTKPVKVVSFNLVYGAIAFFMITAFAHFFYSTDGFGTGAYYNALAQGWNPYRWFEYASSASIMTVLISLSSGNRDFTSVLALYVMTIAMMFSGYSVESLLRGSSKVTTMARDTIRSSTIAGWTLFIGIWVVLFYSYLSLVSDVKTKFANELDNGKKIEVPSWIIIIVILQLIYYALFGFIQLRHISQRLSGKPYSYIETENSYIGLSYIAKLSLASGIGYGLIFRVRDCPEQ